MIIAHGKSLPCETEKLPKLVLLFVASEQLISNEQTKKVDWSVTMILPIKSTGAATSISGIFYFLKVKHFLNCQSSALCQDSKVLKLNAILTLNN